MPFLSPATLRGRWVLFVSVAILWILGLSGYYLRNYRTAKKVIGIVQPISEYYQWSTISRFNPVNIDVKSAANTTDLCKAFPKHLLESIQTVLKLGHGESRERVQAQLESVSACLDNLLLFSDVEEEISGRHTIDIIADLPATYAGDPDLEDYVKQRDWFRQGKEINASEIHGWKLDKFKFLPQIERAWSMRPGRKWYVFYESDTYIVWDNLFRLLDNFDPDHPLYFGSPSPGREKSWFAYGGTGYVLSRAAVKALLARRSSDEGDFVEPSLSQRWREIISSDCCGDSVLGWALIHAKVNISGLWPMFNPHPEQGVPFSHRYWCQPVISMHKTHPERMVSLWRWEFGARSADVSLLYCIKFMLTFYRNPCSTGICFAILHHKAWPFELIGIMPTGTAFHHLKAAQHTARLKIVVESVSIIQTAFSIHITSLHAPFHVL